MQITLGPWTWATTTDSTCVDVPTSASKAFDFDSRHPTLTKIIVKLICPRGLALAIAHVPKEGVDDVVTQVCYLLEFIIDVQHNIGRIKII